jgi:hypothetical protein
MDVGFFLKSRTGFIRNYYVVAIQPFEIVKSQIENEEEPYAPPYSEDGEPPFLEEWMNAETSIQIIGRTCVSMLSESMKVYLQTWERLFGIHCHSALPAKFNKGFFLGYKECFAQWVPVDWDACPANLAIIEEIIEVRNLSQHHTGDISSLNVRYSGAVREKLPNPLFIHDYEKKLVDEETHTSFTFLGSELVITKVTFNEAVREVEALVDWLEPQLQERRWRRG